MTTILITGASSGIGAATALHLDTQGIDVIAGVLPDDGDDALAPASARLRRVSLDVTDPASIASALEGVEALDGLVNNAGIGVAGPLEVLPLERVRSTLAVNVLGQVAVTQAALPLLRRAAAPQDGRARIVFVGSIGGKGAAGVDRYRERLRAFADSLESADDHGLDPSKVAEAVAEALLDDSPDTRMVVGGAGRLATALRPLIPDRLADRLAERSTS